MIRFTIIFSVCVLGSLAQVPHLGKCPEIASVQQNFDLSKYLGTWYEEEKYFAVFELGGKCNSAEYSVNDNGTVKVLNKEIDKTTGVETSIVGNARPLDSDLDDGKFLVNFPGRGIQTDAPYWVLETDYDTYAVVWSCVNIPPLASVEFAWILTRERQPSQEVIDKAHAVFDRNNLSKEVLTKTDQTNC